MSYAFDTMARAWQRLQQALPAEARDGEVAHRFGVLMEEMHDANHRLNDAINKDERISSQARRLAEALDKGPAS